MGLALTNRCGWKSRSPALALAFFVLVGDSFAHEEEKGGRIAAGLAATPAEYLPLNVELVGQLSLGDEADIKDPVRTLQGILITADLAILGDYAYVGSWGSVLHIVDISRPEAMREVARVETPTRALDIKVEGDLAAIGVQGRTGDFGLVLVDISDPPNPRVLAEFSEPGWRGVHNLYLYKQRAYLAHTNSPGLTILDISDPANPFVSGHWQGVGFANVIHDVFIRDDLAFVSDFASGRGGLAILDLADPDNPVLLSALHTAEGAHSAWMEDGYVYFNQEYGGWEQPLHIADVRDPRNPVEVGTFRAQGPPFAPVLGPHNPYVRDGLLYWAYYDAGLRIFDISVPDEPLEVGYYPTPLAWGAQPHEDGLIYVADSLLGLLSLRYQPEIATAVQEGQAAALPQGFALEPNYPNPFNSDTVIRFSLPAAAEVKLGVYNLAGQEVVTLAAGATRAGAHEVRWDGRDGRGKSLASGVYLYQLRSGGQVETRKLLLLK
jgi:hypothetical protein